MSSSVKITCSGILFDSDGVLVDSHAQVVEAWSQLAVEFDLDIETLLGTLVGVRAHDTLGRFLQPDRLPSAVARLEDLEVELATATSALRGAPELLDTLPPGSWTIVTSASRRLGEARWRGAGLPVPERVVTANDVSLGKPHPEPFMLGADFLGLAGAQCVVFEDSAPGGVAARAAGASVVAVGEQPWPEPPSARVIDLHQVIVRSNGRHLELELG